MIPRKQHAAAEQKDRRFNWRDTAIITCLTTILSTVLSTGITYFANQREVSAKYIEMAATVLSAENKSDDQAVNNQTKALRTWAINVINKFAGDDEIKIGGELGRALINGDINLNAYGATATPKPAALAFTPSTPTVSVEQRSDKKNAQPEASDKKSSGNITVSPAPAPVILTPGAG